MAKRTLKVGDEFHKGLCIVRVMTLENPGRFPVRYVWVVEANGRREADHCGREMAGVNSVSGTFKFLEGEGFTYHPVQVTA